MKNNKTHLIKTPLLLAALVAALLFTTAPAMAQSPARVYLQPVEGPPGALTVEVIAENVTNLYGAEFKLKYDPAVLAVQDANPDQEGIQIEGGAFMPSDQGFVVANQADQEAGTVTFAMTLLNPAPPVHGTGPLGRVTFQVLQNLPSSIEIEKAKLVAFDLQIITAEVMALRIDGQGGSEAQPQAEVIAAEVTATVAPATTPAPMVVMAVTAAPAAAPAATMAPVTEEKPDFPWWMVAAAVMLMGMIGLSAFVVMGGIGKPKTATHRQPQPQPAPQPIQPQQPQPREQTTRTRRPSAFK